jgi:outer membrane protein assembly factor BamB
VLLATSSVSGLWALDPATGKQLWRITIPEGGMTSPAPVSGALVVGTTRYGMFLLSPLNGRAIDGLDLGTGFAETPATYGDRAYTMSNAGTLLGVQVEPPIARR